MTKVIDLTVVLGGPNMSLVPGHPPVTAEPIHTHEHNGRSNTKLTVSIHTGTHVDAPYHMYAKGRTIDDVPVDWLIGPGIKVDLRRCGGRGTAITVQHLRELEVEPEVVHGRIVVFHTGWLESMYGQPGFFVDNPHLAPETAHWLVSNGAKALAVDHSVDKADVGVEPHPGDCPIHRILLGGEVLLIENLINLGMLPRDGFQIIALPVRLFHGDGAPARVIATLAD